MKFEYALSFKDYRNAQWLYLKHRPVAMCSYIATNVLLPLVGVVGLMIFLYAVSQHDDGESRTLVQNLVPLFVLFAMVVPLRFLSLWRGYKSLFPRGVSNSVVFSCDSEIFSSELPGRNEARVYWSTLQDSAEDRTSLLLFITKHRFLILPKHSIPAGDLVRLRELAKLSLGSRVGA